MHLSCLPCIRKFGLPPSASCAVNRNVKGEECLNWDRLHNDVISFLRFRIAFTLTKYLENLDFSVYRQESVLKKLCYIR